MKDNLENEGNLKSEYDTCSKMKMTPLRKATLNHMARAYFVVVVLVFSQSEQYNYQLQ